MSLTKDLYHDDICAMSDDADQEIAYAAAKEYDDYREALKIRESIPQDGTWDRVTKWLEKK